MRNIRVFQGTLILLLAVVGAIVGATKGGDFQIFFYGISTAVSEPHLTYAPLDKPIYFLYGPVFLALAYPLSWFSFSSAKAVWIAFECLSYLGLWILLGRFFPRVGEKRWVWFWAFVFLINPVHSNFQWLNIQVPLLTASLLAYGLCETDKPLLHRCAGVLCAIAGAIKIYPFFLLVFLGVTGKRAFRQGVVAGILFSLAFPFVVFGWNDGWTLYRGFFENLTRVGNVDYFRTDTHVMNLHSLIARLLHPFPLAAASAPALSRGLTVGIAGLFLAVSYAQSRTPDWADLFYRRGWCALALALTVFLAPYTFIHYYVFYLPLFFWLLEANRIYSSAFIWVSLGAVTLLVAFTTDFVVGKEWNAFLEANNVPLYGVALLMGTALTRLLLSSVGSRPWAANRALQ